jgi:hypothetical protein
MRWTFYVNDLAVILLMIPSQTMIVLDNSCKASAEKNDAFAIRYRLCEAKFTNKEFTLTKDYTADLRRKAPFFKK